MCGAAQKILWCDDDSIKPYFIAAGKGLTYGNLRRQLADSLEDKPFLALPDALQTQSFREFGSGEEQMKYRPAVMQAYPHGHFSAFENYQRMQYQICEPEGFAEMLVSVMENNALPKLPF